MFGITMFSVGLLYSFYLIFRKLMFDDLASGWPTIISILLIGFGVTNISMGIVAEYLWRTFDAARKSEVFIIDEIIEN
jgi:dolichol-phosphate mannosyltransferase